ncbi:AAT family amino acid transporter [Cryptococcus wingfieldii CBS 7118]|uniref:AAT family amino acid transporter n=1 Tax=Cryptococcus wingfieldii CBS 7118 TaxID=1295528 RepID=A0A1E3IR21_9TREE|nr:AAT family amino acid transporter [Cryptococcus wingfieldii CBS 7118]ODN90161.1 AAT family amino acid transporter [Cryptococcus wingfieldii CBS 7118]
MSLSEKQGYSSGTQTPYETSKKDGGVDSIVTPANGEQGGYAGEGNFVHPAEGGVHRQLKQRHMAMIALGGAIGTGLFVGSGTGGPVGLWLAYILMSSMVYAMMVALGEMAALFPVAGAFTHYAARFVDPSLGFALGFNYWYSYAITIPTEIVAATIVISYWDADTNAAVYITVCLVMIWAINFLGAKAYGEAEFWFSSIKVITIVGLIILGIVLMCGGGPNHDAIGFRYWRNPGAFNQISIGDGVIGGRWGQFLAFWDVFVQAAFSFIGTEIIATTLGEAENPRKTVPKAIKRVFFRLLFFYVMGTFIISVLVPYTEPNLLNGSGTAAASPFVIAIQNAGIRALPSIVNAVLLISAWSAGNSDLYASSRTLYALALEGQMPRILRRCTKRGLPIYCVAITGIFGVLAYMNTGGDTAEIAFNWLYNLSAITGIITWWAILLAYLRFYYGLKKQGLTRDEFPYRAPLQPYLSWYGFLFFSVIILFNGFTVFLKGNWDTSSFVAAYITLPIFAVCWIGWKVVKKTKMVPLDQIDFHTGRRELDEDEAADNEKFKAETKFQKIMGILF